MTKLLCLLGLLAGYAGSDWFAHGSIDTPSFVKTAVDYTIVIIALTLFGE